MQCTMLHVFDHVRSTFAYSRHVACLGFLLIAQTTRGWRPLEVPGTPPLEMRESHLDEAHAIRWNSQVESPIDSTWATDSHAQLHVIPNNQRSTPLSAFSNASHVQSLVEMSERVGWECQLSYNDEANLKFGGNMFFEGCRLLCSDEGYEAFQFNDARGQVEKDLIKLQ